MRRDHILVIGALAAAIHFIGANVDNYGPINTNWMLAFLQRLQRHLLEHDAPAFWSHFKEVRAGNAVDLHGEALSIMFQQLDIETADQLVELINQKM
jgi:hypothetical protein